MQKKFLFISANQLKVPYPVYPLGLSYLYSYLTKKLPSFNFKLIDLNISNIEEVLAYISENNPEYIGISLRNIDNQDYQNSKYFIDTYKSLIDKIKEISKAKIIIGGAGFSIFPITIFKALEPDFAIKGEGEESLHQLIICLENKLEYSHIEGLIFLKNGEPIINERKNYLNNLDLSFDDCLVDYYWENSGMLNIQTKRGCPYHCIYCSYPIIEGRKVRTLNADKIVETLIRLKTEKKINYVFFTDSVFNISNEYNYELATKMIQNDLNIKWGAYFSPHNLTEELLVLFKKAGLKHIEFGTEALSDVQLKNYGKSFTVDEVVKISEMCNRIGIYFAHFLILAGYGETEETLNETFENSKRINSAVFFPYIGMRVYPGTKLFELAVNFGKIKKTDALIEPYYFISDAINTNTIKERAMQTGQKWIFPDDDSSQILEVMLRKKKKGLLWHLIR